jgi:hypothetical protein
MHPQRVAAFSWPYGRAGTLAGGIEGSDSNLVDDDGGVALCR